MEHSYRVILTISQSNSKCREWEREYHKDGCTPRSLPLWLVLSGWSKIGTWAAMRVLDRYSKVPPNKSSGFWQKTFSHYPTFSWQSRDSGIIAMGLFFPPALSCPASASHWLRGRLTHDLKDLTAGGKCVGKGMNRGRLGVSLHLRAKHQGDFIL